MSRRSWIAWIVGIGFLLWIALIIGAFYLVQEQRPVNPEQLVAWWRFLRAGFSLMLIIGGAFSAGLRLLRLLGWTADDPVFHFLTAVTLGLGTLSAIMLVVGMLGAATAGGAWGVLLLAWAVVPRESIQQLRRAWSQVVRTWRQLGLGVQLALVASLGLALCAALLPPTDWDGLFYHLTGPKLAIAAGRIGWMGRHTPHFNFPWFGEALMMLGMLSGGEATAKLLHWAAAVLLTGWVMWFAGRGTVARSLGPHGARWALLLLLAMPMVAVLAGWAYTDLFLTLFVVAETVLLAEGLAQHKADRWFLIVGLVAGFSIGVKYTAVLWPAVGAVLVVAYDLITHRRLTRRTLAYVVGVGLGGLPWLMKSLVLTGNPAYPFLYGGMEWDAFRRDWYGASAPGIWGQVWEILLLPLFLTLGLRDMNFYDGRTGPLWLVLLPAVVVWLFRGIRRRKWQDTHWAWLVVLVLGGAHALGWTWGVLWSASLYQSRLLLPALVVYIWPAVAALQLMRPWRIGVFSPYNFLKLVVAVVLMGNILYQARDLVRLRPSAYLMGLETRETYLARVLGSHWNAMTEVNELPADAKVIFLWEPRSYYTSTEVEPDAILDRWPHLHHLYGTPSGVARALKDEGFTHVLLYERGMRLVRQGLVKDPNAPAVAWDALDDFLQNFLVPVKVMDAYVLYTWNDTNTQ